MDRSLFVLGALFGLLGVAAGAFGAHGLKTRLDAEMMQVYETAVRYHLVHALAILISSLATIRYSQTPAYLAGALFIVGILNIVIYICGITWTFRGQFDTQFIN